MPRFIENMPTTCPIIIYLILFIYYKASMVSPKHKTPSLVVQTFTIWNEFTLLIYNIHIYILCVKTNESQTTILCIYVIKIKVMPLHKNHCSEEIHIFLGLPWKIEKTFKIKHNYCKTNQTMLASTGSLEFYISRRDILVYFLLLTLSWICPEVY